MSNKFSYFREILDSCRANESRPERARLLDVGCRGCELKPYVGDVVEYDGADLVQNSAGTVRFVGDLEKGLPVADQAYDYVVALDVVEHLEDPVAGIDELLRVTRSHLFVMIPNIAHWIPRTKFFLKGEISRKYDFVFPPPRDRHRWLTTQTQADRFFEQYGSARKVSLATHWHLDGPRKTRVAKVMRRIGFSPAMWVWASLYVLSRA